MMRRPYSLLLLPFLCGCVAYPKFYWRTLKGQARIEDGKPITIKAAIVRQCDTVEGEQETEGRARETQTDAQGRYKLAVHGAVWHFKSFWSPKVCTSRIQMYVCREYCRIADQVDIDVLGK